MDFGLNEDQLTLAKYAREFLTNECPTSFVRSMIEHDTAHDPSFYKKMVDLGWTGIAIPESLGGGGMSYVDLAVVLEEMGRALVPGPFFATVCLAAPLLADATTHHDLLEAVATGERIATVATGSDLVLDAHVADVVLVPTSDGITVIDDAGAQPLDGIDMSRRLCRLPSDGTEPATLSVSAALLCAESVGGAQRVLELAVEYAKEREQFGKPIGSFQAVKHKCADMLVDVELGRAATYAAVWANSEGDADARLLTSIAKAFVGEAFTRVATKAIHVFGGIGYTWEADVHLYLKRAKASEVFLGSPAHHREIVAALTAA